MSLSSTASQQRDRQTRLSHPLFAWGVAGSLVFHGGMLPVILLLARQDAPLEPAQIEIVFTEPVEPIPEEEPEPAVFEEETQDEMPTPAQVESQPTSSTPETIEDVPDEVVEEVSEPDRPEPDVSEADASEPEVATEQPSSLDNLLDNIRQRRPSNAQGNGAPASSEDALTPGSSNSSQPSGGDEVATRPTAPPSRPGPRTVACRSCPKPSYPRSALDAGAEGTVNIMVDINANGNVTSATLVGSSGNSVLDQAALSAVRNRWRFQPIRGGASGVVVSVVMTIQGSDLNRRASEQGDRESVDIPSEDSPAEDNPSEENPSEEPVAQEAESDSSNNSSDESTAQEVEPDNLPAPAQSQNEQPISGQSEEALPASESPEPAENPVPQNDISPPASAEDEPEAAQSPAETSQEE